MELLERYIYEVGRYLSPRNREDILAELRSSLVDTLEDRYGENPSQDEIVTVLKEFGSPQKVAASYWPEGQYLVGPGLFPIFRITISITLLVMVIVFAVLIGVMLIFTGEFGGALDLLGSFLTSAMTALGIIVVIFYLLQTFGFKPAKKDDEWDPLKLPVIEDTKTIKRSELYVDIGFSIVLVVLLLVFRNGIPYITTPGAEVNYVINPVLVEYLALVVIALLVGVAIDAVLLWRGRWSVGLRLLKIAGNIFDIVVFGILLTAHLDWLAPYTDGTLPGILSILENLGELPTPEMVQMLMMQGFLIALVVVVIVEFIEIIGQIYNLVRQSLGLDRVVASPDEI